MRRPFVLAVIALHGLLLWILALGFRQHSEPERELPQRVSLWIDLPSPTAPESPPPVPALKPLTNAPLPRPIAEPQPAPITLPLEPTPETAAVPANVPAPAAAPAVDWAGVMARAAKRAGEAAGTTKSDTFSPPPKTLPKACKPKRSMEWKGQEDRRVGMSGGMPYIKLNDHCVLVVVIPMCVIGKLPEANGHLLDDMKDPNRTHSSVPDPNVCD